MAAEMCRSLVVGECRVGATRAARDSQVLLTETRAIRHPVRQWGWVQEPSDVAY